MSIIGELDAADAFRQQLAPRLLELVGPISSLWPHIEPGEDCLQDVHQIQEARAAGGISLKDWG